MDKLNELANIFIILIRAGAGVRISFCFIKMISNENEGQVYKKRIINTLIFFILAELIWKMRDLIKYYFPY